jgi:hypothetical protein
MEGATDTSPGRGIAARMTGLAQAVSRDPVLLRRGRTLDTVCQLNIGDETFLARILDGNIIESVDRRIRLFLHSREHAGGGARGPRRAS